MKLHHLKPAEGSKKRKIRVGRGESGRRGKTAGRGTKGQGSRSGGGVRPGYEGGQMPIHRRLPKRGFTNIFKKQVAVINVKDLNRFESGSDIDEVTLVKQGLVKGRYDAIKLLGQGEIDRPVQIKVHAVSKSAQAKITAAGGTVEVI